jgi:hypothetical protein
MHSTDHWPRKLGAALLVLAVASMIVVTGLPNPQRAQAAYVDPANYVIGIHTPARITKLIYPTIGNPSIVRRGTSLTVEFDPREGKYYNPPSGPWIALPVCTNWVVAVSTTRRAQLADGSPADAARITRQLTVTNAVAAQSSKWPSMANPAPPGGNNQVYILTVTVPESLPADLYDLSVGCNIEGTNYSDTQPNSVNVVDHFKDKFNFIQMSDIHVYGPENSNASIFYSHSRTERTNRSATYDPSPTGVGYGATYLHKEVQEINRIHPDFVICTGDYDFGQRYFHQNEPNGFGDCSQYEFEQEWFYQEISKLEVPVFIVIGNHDGYSYSGVSGIPDQDWLDNWTHLYGPLYFTFDYGPDNRFFAFNSMDWQNPGDRNLVNYLNLILQPAKYLGCVTSGGDPWQAGISYDRVHSSTLNPSLYNGQLGWLRDQLTASQGLKSRVMCMHHDPFKDNGSGSMWASGGDDFISKITGIIAMGDGVGRLALVRLAVDYKVQLMIHGHDHSDCTSEDDTNVSLLDWTAGGGHCMSQNTTSASFQGDSSNANYPGYRRVWMNNGVVDNSGGDENVNYYEAGARSWPFYKGTTIPGNTNLGNLHTPAVQQSWTFVPNGDRQDITCSLSNNYNKPLTGCYMEFPMQMLTDNYYYTISNGTLGEDYDTSAGTRMMQVYTDLNAGQMNKAVHVQKSAYPDNTAPTGSVLINNNDPTTTTPNVALTLEANDAVTGVGQMKISNDSDFSDDEWEPYKTTKSWTLSGSGSGERTVYVKYRDRAMPGNEVTKTDTIYYEYTAPSGPKLTLANPNSGSQGQNNLLVTITGQNTNFVQNVTYATFTREGRAPQSDILVNGPGQYGTTTVLSPTQCRVNLQISGSALMGKWDVNIVDSGEQVTPLHNGFTVTGPEITSVTPSEGSLGQTLDVVVAKNGVPENFINGMSRVHFFRNGVDISDPNTIPNAADRIDVYSNDVTDPTHCTAHIVIGANLDPGPVDVNVITSDWAIPLEDGFTLIDHTPRIVSLSPQAGVRGQTHLNVTIHGVDTSFVGGQSHATFSGGSDITVNSTTVTSATTAIANIDISGSADISTRDVNVITGSQTPNPLVAGFAVEYNSPVIQTISPAQALNTGTVTMHIYGYNFQNGAAVKLTKASQPDIPRSAMTFVNATHLICNFDIDGQAAGPWTLVVTNPDGKDGELTDGFTVQWATPTVASIVPDSHVRGTTQPVDVPVTITGAHFNDGATVKLTKAGQPDINPYMEVTVANPNQITTGFELSTTVHQGRYNLVVTNSDGQSATLVNGFTIPYDAPPTFATITPNSGEAGNLVSATITGTEFHPGTVAVLSKSGSSNIVSINNVVADTNPAATSFTCDFDLSGASWGYWNIQIVNEDGQASAVSTMAYHVTQSTTPPHITSISPTSGAVGTTVTIKGTNFGYSRSSSVVRFTGAQATTYNAWSDTSITCKVPAGAATGPVLVSELGQLSNSVNFEVTSQTPVQPDTPYWYLAEGTSDYGFDTYITIENPNTTAVTAMVTYMTKTGPHTRAALKLNPMSQTVINPRNDIGATDFSTKVECKEGKTICVDRRMTWTGPGAPSQEGHSSVGVMQPSKVWYLAEGSSKWGFETWLLVQNPNSSKATVTITYMIEGQGPVQKVKTVEANSRASFNMETDIGQVDASIKVEANVPVIPERAMYRNNRREGHDSIGTTTPAKDYYLAEGTTDWGFTTWVLVQNPNSSAATINITYMTPSGPVAQTPFTMAANSRKTVNVNGVVPKKDVSIHVSGSQPIIAERAMYWGAGTAMGEACHDSIGMNQPHMNFFLPDGETYNGTETWTLVQNPNSTAVSVEVSYLTSSGTGNMTFTQSIPANSRKSYNMGEKLPSGRAAILVKSKTPGKKIMVERSMYWHSRGAGTDTIGGYSD